MIGYGGAICAAVFIGVFVYLLADDEDARFAAGAASFFATMVSLALFLLWAFTGFVMAVGQ